MNIVHTLGKRNVAWVKPTDMVESIEDPAHYLVGYKLEEMGQGEAAASMVISKVESKDKSPSKDSRKSYQLPGFEELISRTGGLANLNSDLPHRPRINIRCHQPNGCVRYHYDGIEYLCPPGQEPWNDKATLESCFVRGLW